MKCIVILLCIANLVYAEGFVADTVVHTQQGLVSIENVQHGDYVIINYGNQLLSYVVMCSTIHIVDHYVKITVKDVVLSVAADQKLYVVNKGWVCANELVLSDLLLCDNRKWVELTALEIVYSTERMHVLSVEFSHVFCVTKYGIIVHNIEPIGTSVAAILLPICPPVGAVVIIGDIVTLGVVGFIAYLIHKKSRNENQTDKYPVYSGGVNNCSCGGRPPKHEDDEEEHPHGIYEDAGYHHFNSYGKKSACPNNGQKCLDKSFPVYKNTTLRITIEDGKFVILRQSIPGKFHGYVVESWQELCNEGSKTQLIRNAFQKHKFVNKAGKIIKNN